MWMSAPDSPKHFVRGEWVVVTAPMAGVAWIIADALGASTWLAAGIAVVLATRSG